MSSPERKTKFLQGVAGAFINLDKDEEAKKLADGNKEILNALKAKPIRQLLKDKKFDEALKVAETLDAEIPDGERSKTQIKRQIGILRYRETNDEKYLQQIAATFTDEEKKQISELDNAVQQASAITNPEEQRTALLQAVQTQYQIGNVTGVKQVLVLLLANVEKETDVVKLVSQRLILARLQADVNDKAGMKANLGKLLEKLSGVKDIMELKELVPERQQENPIAAAGGEAVKLKVPVDRTAVEDQLFNVYITVADDFRKAEADAEAKAVLQKARQIAESATDAARKADMLFFMMQFLNQKN
ncbi:hypothetical protein FACS189419_09570 [Planctomycetales bacterium]|nr:hypothetical protein FACS189419_09570 [Planctomycetales bacterium]